MPSVDQLDQSASEFTSLSQRNMDSDTRPETGELVHFNGLGNQSTIAEPYNINTCDICQRLFRGDTSLQLVKSAAKNGCHLCTLIFGCLRVFEKLDIDRLSAGSMRALNIRIQVEFGGLAANGDDLAGNGCIKYRINYGVGRARVKFQSNQCPIYLVPALSMNLCIHK
jgi:hypothetical protein